LLNANTEPKDRVLIIAESVYSAAGDIAPLAALVEIKNEFGCHLLVDEAHSLGMFGRQGEGMVAELGLSPGVDIITGTFSKSFGLIGGFAASSHPDFDCLRYSARAFMFTAALPPPVVAACRVSLRKIKAAEDKRARLWRNADHLRRGIQALGLRTFSDRTAVVSAVYDDLEACYGLWSHLLEAGFYANLLLPPATSHGACVIRFSVCSEHRMEDIDALLSSIARCIGALPTAGAQAANGNGAYASPMGLVVSTERKAGAPAAFGSPSAK
jgi:7-keto-8-aminopelargonate synthetase-like enzyme